MIDSRPCTFIKIIPLMLGLDNGGLYPFYGVCQYLFWCVKLLGDIIFGFYLYFLIKIK